jgi:hypothetical protein
MEYMTDSQGRQAPLDMVKPVDKLRDQTVRAVMEKTFAARNALARFKAEAWEDIQTFLSLSAEEHNVAYGGKKGNVSLSTYDGRYKLIIAVSDTITVQRETASGKDPYRQLYPQMGFRLAL